MWAREAGGGGGADVGEQKTQVATKSTVNYHLSRFYRNVIGPHKHK